MQQLRVTYAAPDENLACDEWLLDRCARGLLPATGVLRFWESVRYFAVLGLSNQTEKELQLDVCKRDQIPVLRRCSGGGTVLQGPGCLNYSLILPVSCAPELSGITRTNRWILERHQKALLTPASNSIKLDGTSDLTLNGRKFSGNAQRRLKNAILIHGTFLYRFDLDKIERYLHFPPRPPSYRGRRTHSDFLTNLPLSAEQIREAIASCWNAVEPGLVPPDEEITHLAQTRTHKP